MESIDFTTVLTRMLIISPNKPLFYWCQLGLFTGKLGLQLEASFGVHCNPLNGTVSTGETERDLFLSRIPNSPVVDTHLRGGRSRFKFLLGRVGIQTPVSHPGYKGTITTSSSKFMIFRWLDWTLKQGDTWVVNPTKVEAWVRCWTALGCRWLCMCPATEV